MNSSATWSSCLNHTIHSLASSAHDKDAPLRRQVRLTRPVAADHRRRNVGVAAERRFMIVTGVALKQRLPVSGRPYPRDQAAAVGTGNGNKRRHVSQAER